MAEGERISVTEPELKNYIACIRPADSAAAGLASARQAKLAKPPGSLGKLEDISVKLAGITGRMLNEINACRVLVFAADNGVVREGVAVTPSVVTLAQCINMTRHKTGMSALAGYFGNDIRVYDVGINKEFSYPGILDRKVRLGTDSIMRGPAMTRNEALLAIGHGIAAAEDAALDGMDAVGVGEMGIGNTSTSAAVLAALTGRRACDTVGRGSGLTDDAYKNKIKVVQKALDVNKADSGDPVGVISKVGGLDIAAMTGAFLGLAAKRIPAVVDGFISITAALCAVRLCPKVRDFIFLSHASAERGYIIAANELEMEPFMLLEMRLGEGSGCPIAFEVLKAACAAMNGMATFEEAAIDDGYLDCIRSRI